MTEADFETMGLDELRRYVLAHHDGIRAFQRYVDRSKAEGRMITINPADPNWEDRLEQKIQQAGSGEAESSVTSRKLCNGSAGILPAQARSLHYRCCKIYDLVY